MRLRSWIPVMVAMATVSPSVARAQMTVAGGPLRLSLTEAIGAALERSEEVRLAGAQVDAASALVKNARSAFMPQINTQVAYTRALRSVFQSVGGIAEPAGPAFEPDPTASVEDRIRYLELNTEDAAFGALGRAFSGLPFGNENTWVAALTVSQPIFAGGRIRANLNVAHDSEDAARAGLGEARADVVLQVERAYYDAILAATSAEIVEASVVLAQQHMDQVRLQLDAGRASELDGLRAEVDLENLRPQLVQAKNAQSLSQLNLKRLINVPLDAEIELTTELGPDATGAPAILALDIDLLRQAAADRLAQRQSVRAAEARVAAAGAQIGAARSAYLPSLSLNANLSRQAFPSGTFGIPSGGDWRDDWSVGFTMNWSLFQGLRRSAETDAAKATQRQAQLQLAQVKENVRVEYEQAIGELERSRSQIDAATHTVKQAQKVYDLTELRFGEGLATQLDVSDARLALQQARINEVQAYHAAHVAFATAQRSLGLTGGEPVFSGRTR